MQRHVECCVERFRPPSRTSPFWSLRRYLSWECGRVYHCLSDRVPLPFLVLASHGVLRHLFLACCEHFTKQRRSKAHGLCFECDKITHPHSVQSSPSAVSIGVKVKVKKIDLAGSEGLEGMNVGNIKPLHPLVTVYSSRLLAGRARRCQGQGFFKKVGTTVFELNGLITILVQQCFTGVVGTRFQPDIFGNPFKSEHYS